MKLTALCVLAVSIALAEAKCRYTPTNGTAAACNSTTGLRMRTLQLNRDGSDADCPATRTLAKVCNADSGCRYQRRRAGTWTQCDAISRTVSVTRTLVSGEGCPSQVTEVFSCRGRVAKNNRNKSNKKKKTKPNKQERRRRRQKKKAQNQRRQASKGGN